MKERLTGAIILVVLVVLLVPELLSGPKGPAATPPVPGAASPSSEEPPLRSYTINLGDEHSQSQAANGSADSSGPPQPSVQAQPTTAPDTNESSTSWDSAAADQQSSSSGANPASTPANTSASAASSARQATPAASSPTNASPQSTAREQPKPTTAAPRPGQAARPEPAKPSVSTAATPKPAQPAPPVARAEPAKPARTAAAEKPTAKPHAAEEKPAAASAESGGWGVQLGVFGSKENAERLVQQARVKGFKASVSPITSGKNKMYRVRVGPAPDKAAAQELQTRLKAVGIAHPDAKVVPYS